jgi:hypothetical protein
VGLLVGERVGDEARLGVGVLLAPLLGDGLGVRLGVRVVLGAGERLGEELGLGWVADVMKVLPAVYALAPTLFLARTVTV